MSPHRESARYAPRPASTAHLVFAVVVQVACVVVVVLRSVLA